MSIRSLVTRTLVTFVSLFSLTLLAPAAFADNNPHVLLTTSVGNIELELDHQKAPISTKNFVDYVNSGHYNNTIFHRVIPGFVIQGGGFTADMQFKKTNPPIENEANNGLRNERGTLAMARTSDKNSATTQFFVNLKNNSSLDNSYAVFGKVVNGMDVIDKIAEVDTENVGPHQNVPIKPVVILSAKVLP